MRLLRELAALVSERFGMRRSGEGMLAAILVTGCVAVAVLEMMTLIR